MNLDDHFKNTKTPFLDAIAAVACFFIYEWWIAPLIKGGEPGLSWKTMVGAMFILPLMMIIYYSIKAVVMRKVSKGQENSRNKANKDKIIDDL